MEFVDYDRAFSTSNIQLEPRLQEYLNRKTFNRENDIRPDIPEEQEFSISKEDKRVIKRYLTGKRHVYTKRRTGNSSHFIDVKDCEGSFDDKDVFKSDPRYKRLQKKMASHKRAQAQIRNLEGISEDYDIFHRSNPYDDPANPNVKRPQRVAKPYDDPNFDEEEDLFYSRYPPNVSGRGIYRRDGDDYSIDAPDSVMMDSRDLVLGNSKGERDQANRYMYNPNDRRSNPRRSESSYHHEPQISYRQRLIPQQVDGGLEHNHSTEDIIGNLDEYNHHLEETHDYIEAEVDQDSHQMRPSARSGSKREQYNGYRSVPYGYGGGLADISVENSLRGGIRDSRRKTTGFWNPFEHQFDYIDKDISDPNHTVEMRPQATRGANRTIARPRSAAARSQKHYDNERAREHRQYERTGTHECHAQRNGYADPNRDQDDYRRNMYHR